MSYEADNVVYEDAKLLDLVKKNAFIYNRNDYRFKNKLERKKAWQRIGAALHIDAQECQTRFLNCRNRYNVERNKILKTRETENRDVDSDWPLYKAIQFLAPFVKHRRRSSYRVLRINETNKQEINGVEADMPLQDPLLTSCDVSATPNTHFSFQMSGSSNSETAQSPIHQTEHEYYTNTSPELATVDLPETVCFAPEVDTKYAINIDNQLMSRIQKIEESIKQDRKQKTTLTSNDDQFQSFGRTIAFMLANIKNNKRQRKAMADVLKRVSEYDTDSDSE